MDRNMTDYLIGHQSPTKIEEILQLYMTLLNSTYNGIIAVDREARIIFMNQAAEAMLGHKFSEVKGTPLETVVPDADVRMVLTTGVAQTSLKVRQKNNRVMVTNRTPIIFNGEIIGMVGVFQDISDIEAMSDELDSVKQVNQRLQQIIDSIYDGIIICDGKGHVTSINASYQAIAQVRPGDYVGKHVTQLLAEGFIDQSITLKVLETKEPVNLSIRVKSGRDLFHSAVPIFDDKGEISCTVTVIRDLTELNNLRRKLEETEAEKSLYYDALRRMHDLTESNDVVCFSSEMKSVFQVAEQVARFDTTVLITGESGTGKEVVARFIHKNSPRKNNPFVRINCGAIPENLLESELFGYEEGAFTGAAKRGKKGLLDEADQGSFLLDEISELPLSLQVKLLRLLQEREFYRVGGSTPIRLDIRFMATSNKNLALLVKEGKFRSDLFYRLNVVQIYVPPLRERKEVIPAFVKLFLNKFNIKYKQNKSLTNHAIALLSSYEWPGNIRELENTIERLAVTCQDDLISHPQVLTARSNSFGSASSAAEQKLNEPCKSLKDSLDKVEKDMIQQAIEQAGCTRKAGELLGVNQSTIVKKMKKYGIKGRQT